MFRRRVFVNVCFVLTVAGFVLRAVCFFQWLLDLDLDKKPLAGCNDTFFTPQFFCKLYQKSLIKSSIKGGERSGKKEIPADAETDGEAEGSGNDDLRACEKGRPELQHDQSV